MDGEVEQTPAVVETPAPETPDLPVDSGGTDESSGGNPAWQSILDVLPTSLHGLVKPELEKWDRGVQDRFTKVHEKYAPYKPFIEQNVDPNRLNLGYRLVNDIDQDPVGFYTRMGEKFRAAGLIKEAEAAERKADEAAEADEQVPEFKDPRLDTFMQNLEQAKQELELQQAQAEADKQIEQELSDVIKMHGGPLSPELQRELLLRAAAEFDAAVSARRQPPTLMDSYKGLMQFHSNLAKAPRAPQVIPSGSGRPAPTPVNFRDLADNPQARKAYALEVLKNQNGG